MSTIKRSRFSLTNADSNHSRKSLYNDNDNDNDRQNDNNSQNNNQNDSDDKNRMQYVSNTTIPMHISYIQSSTNKMISKCVEQVLTELDEQLTTMLGVTFPRENFVEFSNFVDPSLWKLLHGTRTGFNGY